MQGAVLTKLCVMPNLAAHLLGSMGSRFSRVGTLKASNTLGLDDDQSLYSGFNASSEIELLAVTTELSLVLDCDTPMIFKLVPSQRPDQVIKALTFDLVGGLEETHFADGHGNQCMRALMSKGASSLRVSFEGQQIAAASTSLGHFVPIQALPVDVLPFLQPSRYCEADQFLKITREVLSGTSPGYEQVARICSFVQNKFSYEPGSSRTPRSALDAMQDTAGVCRDFAHVSIAMLRSISIPARYVVGYLGGLQPQDVHAWGEAYVGNRWVAFDATPGLAPGERIAIAIGRDAAEVAIMDQFGPLPSSSQMRVSVRVQDPA
jgi:hypothetical protein